MTLSSRIRVSEQGPTCGLVGWGARYGIGSANPRAKFCMLKSSDFRLRTLGVKSRDSRSLQNREALLSNRKLLVRDYSIKLKLCTSVYLYACISYLNKSLKKNINNSHSSFVPSSIFIIPYIYCYKKYRYVVSGLFKYCHFIVISHVLLFCYLRAAYITTYVDSHHIIHPLLATSILNTCLMSIQIESIHRENIDRSDRFNKTFSNIHPRNGCGVNAN